MFVTNATLAFSPILSQCLSHSDSHKSIVYVKIYTHTEATRDDIQTDAILNTPIVVCIAYSHMRAAYYTKKTLQICSMNEVRTHTLTHTHATQPHKSVWQHAKERVLYSLFCVWFLFIVILVALFQYNAYTWVCAGVGLLLLMVCVCSACTFVCLFICM